MITPLMRQRMKPARIQEVLVVPMPAPVKGWNTRDGLAVMKPEYAVTLDNYFPNADTVDLRGGSERHATHIGQISSFTRASTATYFDANGIMQTAAIDVPRYNLQVSPPTLIIESARTNDCLWGRDLTNAVWVKTNVTALKNVTGVDGVSNSASRITATSANGTCLQTVTTGGSNNMQFRVKRLTGSGALEVTLDNGSNWTPVSNITTNSWTSVTAGAGGVNPTVGFRIVTSGDAFAIDVVLVGVSSNGYPIPTTSAAVTQAADTVSYQSGASASVIPSPVETLMPYSSGTTNKFLAACNGGIYNATSEGPVGAPLATGLTSNRWSHVNFKSVLLFVNGSDTPRTYNGTSISTTSITGVTALSYVAAHKNRLWFIEKNTLKAAYLATDAISGAATYFDLTNFFKLGGRLVAIGTWTRDGGDGMDDLWVAVTNKGEVAIYQGTDPSSANTWALVGIFRIAAPVGDRPLIKLGSDLIVITEDGYLPLSAAISLDRAGATKTAISDNIRPEVAKQVKTHGSKFGWQGILYPRGNKMIFNVPTREGERAVQHVVNVLTGAWCQFKDWNAVCWEIFNEELYFGADNGFVVKADTTSMKDDTLSYDAVAYSAIVGYSRPAFSYFGKRTQLKHFTMARPVISSNGNPTLSLALNVDYEEDNPQAVTTPEVSGSVWDEAPWETSPWSSSVTIRKSWQTVTGYGYSASLGLRTSTKGLSISLHSIDYAFKQGGVM